ncbi:hypothetical protein RUND412_000738 [Rhizina undulata]
MARVRKDPNAPAIAVYMDTSAGSTVTSNNGEEPSRPALAAPAVLNKRKRTADDLPPPTAPPTTRRALREKNPNPSSSEGSFLRSDKGDSVYIEKKNGKPKSKLGNESFVVADIDNEAATSLLKASAIPGNPIYEKLRKELVAKDFNELLRLLRSESVNEAANLIDKKGAWSPELVEIFRDTNIETFDLSSPASPFGTFIPHIPPARTLEVFFQQNTFLNLKSLNLRNTPINNDDVALLRLLPALVNIDLTNTGIDTQALHHLVCHRHNLKIMHIAHNSGIDDDARVALSAFRHLEALYLRGTSFTMPGLRLLATKHLADSCRLMSIPAGCIEYLNNRTDKYALEIPSGYVQDASLVGSLTAPNLKRNLELHAKFNKDVVITGGKADMVGRLVGLLQARNADERIVGLLGRKHD